MAATRGKGVVGPNEEDIWVYSNTLNFGVVATSLLMLGVDQETERRGVSTDGCQGVLVPSVVFGSMLSEEL